MAEDMTGKLDLILAKATAHIGDVRYAATLDSGVPIDASDPCDLAQERPVYHKALGGRN